MAKKYLTVGSVVKGRDGKPDYIKMNADVTLTKGQIVNLRSQKDRLASVDFLEKNNKVSPENAAKMRERAEKIPSFVRFELELVTEE